MRVLVDTSIWSEVYRRRQPSAAHRQTIHELIEQERIVLIGPVRQEVLSGIRAPGQFRRLRVKLRSFPGISLKSRDYERAAAFFNRCVAHGVQGSNTDMLLCAVATRRRMQIYTSDRDFEGYARLLPIRLFNAVI